MSEEKKDGFVLWSELHGQMYSRKIERGMLVDSKMFLENASIKGSSNPKSKKALLKVAYDRDYVIRVLIKRVIEPLSPMSWNQYQALLSEAYKVHKSEQTGDKQS